MKTWECVYEYMDISRDQNCGQIIDGCANCYMLINDCTSTCNYPGGTVRVTIYVHYNQLRGIKTLP